MGDLIVADPSVLKADGQIDVDVVDTKVALRLVGIINKSLAPRAALVNDPRFVLVRQSIGYTILETAGMVTTTNKYIDAIKFAQFRVLFNAR